MNTFASFLVRFDEFFIVLTFFVLHTLLISLAFLDVVIITSCSYACLVIFKCSPASRHSPKWKSIVIRLKHPCPFEILQQLNKKILLGGHKYQCFEKISFVA